MIIHRRALLAAAGALALPSGVVGAVASGPFRFKPMNGQEVDAEWGAFEVPEDRRDLTSRRITLRYVRFKSTAATPGYPLVYLAGGPGGSGVGTARGARFPIFQALRAVGDVIAFDQRGTGASNAIPLRPQPPAAPPAQTREGLTQAIRAELRRAWSDWTAAGVAMGGYNTVESADDLDALRLHLGAEKLNLWGISYGSHLGLAALKRHGSRIDRVALASLEGLDQTVKRPARLDGYFDQIDRMIGQDPEARAVTPDLPALMRRVHARLEETPARVTVRTGTGGSQELLVGGFAVQMIAGGLIKNPNTLVMLPGFYRALEMGQYGSLAPWLGSGALGVSGMPEAMDLASGISSKRLARVEREAKTAVLGDALNFPMPHLLGTVPGVDLGPAFRASFRIPNPALLIAGSLDGRTPLAEQVEVAAQFRNKNQILVENAGHDVLEAHPGVQDLLVRFFKGESVGDTPLSLPPPKFRVV